MIVSNGLHLKSHGQCTALSVIGGNERKFVFESARFNWTCSFRPARVRKPSKPSNRTSEPFGLYNFVCYK